MPISSSVSAIIGYNRLEPRPRSSEFNRSLRAEIRDATWLLARQWQMREFQAEDRGVPAYATLKKTVAHPSKLLTTGQTAEDYDAELLPLDTRVEAQFVLPDIGARLQMGFLADKILRQGSLGPYRGVILAAYPLQRVSSETDRIVSGIKRAQAETEELLQALRNKALDGYALLIAATDGSLQALLSSSVTMPQEQLATLCASLATTLRNSFARVHYTPTGAQGWAVEAMGYKFALAAPSVSTQKVALATQESIANTINWYSADIANATVATALGTPIADATAESDTFIPSGLRIPGTPNSRWWEFEDRKIDFGKVVGHNADYGRLLLQEFMFLYQDDWFSVPLDAPIGTVNSVQSLIVTDVFGQRFHIYPAGNSPLKENEQFIDSDWGSWSFFAQSTPGDRTKSVPQLFLPPTTLHPLRGKVLERVFFKREEATNLVWAVEQTINNGIGQGMEGAHAANQLVEYLRSLAIEQVDSSSTDSYTHQLQSRVPEHWIPFVQKTTTTGATYFQQGALLRQISGLDMTEAEEIINPRTSLLSIGGFASPYVLEEHTILPTGVRIDTVYRRARWLNGKTYVWLAREKSPGQPQGGSGLLFDLVKVPSSTQS